MTDTEVLIRDFEMRMILGAENDVHLSNKEAMNIVDELKERDDKIAQLTRGIKWLALKQYPRCPSYEMFRLCSFDKPSEDICGKCWLKAVYEEVVVNES